MNYFLECKFNLNATFIQEQNNFTLLSPYFANIPHPDAHISEEHGLEEITLRIYADGAEAAVAGG